AAVPRRVPVQAVTQEPVVRLAPERKHLTNLIKMVAYQAESDLLRLVAPHYRRADQEGRTLIQSALASAADLEVTQTELRVTLASQSSPHRFMKLRGRTQNGVTSHKCRSMAGTDESSPYVFLRMAFMILKLPNK